LHAQATKSYRHLAAVLAACAFLAVAAGCAEGPGITGSFDRSYAVTGHTRLEINNAGGDIGITGSADGKVHVRGDVRISGNGSDAQKRLADISSNPPVDQTSDVVRIGRDVTRLHGVSVAYTIEVPRDTEVACTSSSGALTVRGLRGPVKLQSASGALRVENVDGDAQLTTNSGAISASNMGDDVRASSDSGEITISVAKGDIRATNQSGNIKITRPGGRVEATLESGSIAVEAASGDMKLHGVSGSLRVQGTPLANSYWELKNISGSMEIALSPGANLHLLAESTSGEIRADIALIIEEQGKHSLRAQIGNGGGRIEAHTVSGEIHLTPSN
jgi:Toastrack DUF4097